VPGCEPDQLQDSGAVYRICMPEPDRWNEELVVYAHGYVAPDRPIEIPEDQLGPPDGPSLSEIANLLGFAFATTSYRTNGLAVRPALEDLVDLVDIFIETHGVPAYVYLVGASEGGLITALAIERYPEVFDGGLSACGPVGDFNRQVNYFGDFRIVFDYFFPGVLPGSAVDVPQELIDDWNAVYAPLVVDAIQCHPDAAERLLYVTEAPVDWRDAGSVEATVLGLLWYNVHATNDAIVKLGGQPVDNVTRPYKGLPGPLRLDSRVERVRADPEAMEEIEWHYQASGALTRPLVTLHTTRDPIVPFWHERLYLEKVLAQGNRSLLIDITIRRYGHCNFAALEFLDAFVTLVSEVRGEPFVYAEEVLLDAMPKAHVTEVNARRWR
jgi:pimeloyl-ACP methyl ester carboxylesterase